MKATKPERMSVPAFFYVRLIFCKNREAEKMLKESEWDTINTILLELYTCGDTIKLAEKMLFSLKPLISFTKGYFVQTDEINVAAPKRSWFLGFKESQISAFREKEFRKDYHAKLLGMREGAAVAFRDTALMDEEKRFSSAFFRNFLKPAGMYYGAGIFLKHQEAACLFCLYREKEAVDFSKRDMHILDILTAHLENIVSSAANKSGGKNDSSQEIFENCISKAAKAFLLSGRETEILRLIANGKSNNEISEELCVSLSTVKKHVYNIFNKAGVNSRTQLLNTMYNFPI